MHGNRAYKEVALTFDDGPHLPSRSRILDTLKQYGAVATFFDVGKRMDESPALVARTLREGHQIANHSQNHNRLDTLNARDRHREINDADISYCRITGQHLLFLRPPGMRYNDTVLATTRQLGYLVVGCTTLSDDFDPDATPADITARTLQRTENGSIVLLHDYPSTADALPGILAALRARGYRFVTIPQMLAHLPEPYRKQAHQFLATQTQDAARNALPLLDNRALRQTLPRGKSERSDRAKPGNTSSPETMSSRLTIRGSVPGR
jgi:peptidoglycan/xylan/chitin deacetylase (PgdA/CDA1 family)